MEASRKRWRVIAGLVAFNLAFAAGLALLPRHTWSSHLWADACWTVASLGCAAELFRVARRLPASRERAAWRWFGAGVFCFFLGMPVWSWFELIRGEVAPVARIADAGFIGMAPCFVAALIAVRTAPSRPHRAWAIACELGIAVSLIVLLGGALLYRPIQQFTGSVRFLAASLIRAIVYSATALFAAMSIAGGRVGFPPRVASLLFAGIGALAGLYVAFAYALLTYRYETGGWLDATWLFAFSFLFLAGFEREASGGEERPARQRPHPMVWLWGTLLLALGAGAVTFWTTLSGEVRFLLVVLGLLTLFLAIRWEISLSAQRSARRELLDAVRLREDFLTLVGHELRTPLMPLKLRLAIVRRVVDSAAIDAAHADQIRCSVSIADRQLDRIEHLVEDLLDVARLESGTLPLNREEVSLGELVRDVVARHRDSAGQAHCRLVVEEESAPRGRWDRRRIEQVVTKLLVNAIKFGAGKPIEIGISSQDDRARLEVRDHGIGIAREDQERIFRKLERAAPVSSYGGLGLGLFIVGQIVRRHGGTFRLESEPGQGADFIVELPLVVEANPLRVSGARLS